MNEKLRSELQKTLEHIGPNWKRQNDHSDRSTNFIYTAESYDDVVSKAEAAGCDVKYALHRWYNFKTSKECERIFAACGAKREVNPKNKTVDFYVNGEPFDLKLTVYPAKLSVRHPYNLTTREGKNRMIRWLYENQSQGGRKHLANRLFIVCEGEDPYESLKLKSDFAQIEQGIKEYMEGVKRHGFNHVDITDDDIIYSVASDIIHIK